MKHVPRLVRAPLFWLLVVYLLTGLVYALVTPVFEKPDEDGHYGYIRYLRAHRALPPLSFSEGFQSEYKQPPLYYLVASILTAWLPDDANAARLLDTNPYVDFSVPGYREDNRNVFLHPPHMTPLVLGGRLTSLLFGLGTVIAAYWLASEVFPEQSLAPLATAAVVGFQPKFLYIATAINNDAAAAFLGASLVAVLIRRLKRGDFRRFAPLAGALIGIAALTKVSALVFLPLTGLALLLIHRKLSRAFFRDAVVIATVALLIGGWWYARNGLLYGDPLSTNVHALTAAEAQPLAERFWRDLSSIERTFWANLARTFVSPTRLDQALIWWGRISLALLLLRFTLSAFRFVSTIPFLTFDTLLLLLSWPGAFLFLLIVYWAQEGAWAYGRLMFPALAPLSVLFVLGWLLAFPARLRRIALSVGVGTLVVTGILTPWVSLRSLYRPWRTWQAQRPIAYPTDIVYVDPETSAPVARLLGYDLPAAYIHPGDYLPIELCWEPLSQTDATHTLLVQILDPSQTEAHGAPGVWGRRRTYPGLGNLPTDRWAVGRAFCDRVLVFVSPATPTPLGASIEIVFIEAETGRRLRAIRSGGDALDIAAVRGVPVLSPAEATLDERLPRYVFDGVIGLNRAQITNISHDALTLTLVWRSLAPAPYDATIFAHLRGADGEMLAQADRQPLDGRFPSSYWLPGQVVTDTLTLSPAQAVDIDDAYVLHFGMYTWPSLERLPVMDATGHVQRDHMIEVNLPRSLSEEEVIIP